MSSGAGGSSGGTGSFFIGLIMMTAGSYLFLNSIRVTHRFGLGYGIFNYRGFSLTGGMVLIPLIFGIGMIFYNSKNIAGWALSLASFVMLGFGIIQSINFSMMGMSAFDLVCILVLMAGGAGMFLNSLRNHDTNKKD